MLLHSRNRELRLRRWATHGDEEVAAGGGSRSSWCAREARKGGEQRRGKQRATRGHVQKREVELGVLCRRSAAEAERSKGGSGGDRGRRTCKCQEDPFANRKTSRDSSVKKDFPLIQNPSEKNV
jgi:hypothetical protein